MTSAGLEGWQHRWHCQPNLKRTGSPWLLLGFKLWCASFQGSIFRNKKGIRGREGAVQAAARRGLCVHRGAYHHPPFGKPSAFKKSLYFDSSLKANMTDSLFGSSLLMAWVLELEKQKFKLWKSCLLAVWLWENNLNSETTSTAAKLGKDGPFERVVIRLDLVVHDYKLSPWEDDTTSK
jgi:hypothetical protein